MRSAASQTRLGNEAERRVVDMPSRSETISSRRATLDGSPCRVTLIISRKSRIV